MVFAAPDAKSVHCLNLADGTLAWSQKRSEDDLYLGGVFAGRVLIVGKKNVRGLSLERGETLWTLETGTPSRVTRPRTSASPERKNKHQAAPAPKRSSAATATSGISND